MSAPPLEYVLTVSDPARDGQWDAETGDTMDPPPYKEKADTSRRYSAEALSFPSRTKSSKFRDKNDGFAIPSA